MKDICKNCGAWQGLHHYETNQCPRNGQESPLGKLQEWGATIYQEDDDSARIIAEQAETIKRLTASLKDISHKFDHETYANVKDAVLKARAVLAELEAKK